MEAIRNMALLIGMLITIVADAQTCGNPGARLARLRADNFTRDSINSRVKNDIEFIEFNNYDTIADIGSYDGFYPLLYSIFTDSISFYLNDISPTGFVYFDSLRQVCLVKMGADFTNSFQIVTGNDSSCNLPGHFFNKVIVRDALHHFRLMGKMLQDIKRIMKPGAKLFLFEPVKGETNMPNMCRGAMTRQELFALMTKNGFTVARELPIPATGYWFEFRLTGKW